MIFPYCNSNFRFFHKKPYPELSTKDLFIWPVESLYQRFMLMLRIIKLTLGVMVRKLGQKSSKINMITRFSSESELKKLQYCSVVHVVVDGYTITSVRRKSLFLIL